MTGAVNDLQVGYKSALPYEGCSISGKCEQIEERYAPAR